MIVGAKLYYLDETPSTQDYALSLTPGAPDGTVVLANQQTAGRARKNRPWYSPEGGIWMSVYFKTDQIAAVSLLNGVAVCEAMHDYDVLLGLKWPNDLMLNGRKVGGLLCTPCAQGAVIGIGLNLNVRRFPPELQGKATSIFLETRRCFEKMMVFRSICRELERYYLFLKEQRFSEIVLGWRNYTVMLGRNVSVTQGDQVSSGRVIDISSDGALVLLQADGSVVRVSEGDCVMNGG